MISKWFTVNILGRLVDSAEHYRSTVNRGIGPLRWPLIRRALCASLRPPWPPIRFPVPSLGATDQSLVRISAEDELDVARLVPLIQLPGLREVGVAAQQDRLESAAPAQRGGLVQILIGTLVAGPVARAVHQVQRLLGVGQGNQQRMESPLPVVTDVHSGFALAKGGGNG